ncbi:Biopolymer transport protein ExbD [Nitrospirillum viridazoti Y2]|uniref:Cell division and transport-associated protein TolR n=1 Tax=Nitrospirillum amazonense TaxID=28077 RepID=A0A560HQM1_9PROT|nr:protein TolR [Nitrospirillum amazonense]EGY01702.1 Biopolymer transport protein ExbD [Nitrospirillum amazonense Y2]TWB47799.1 cell division and transport-associated protein TolR [Nitrospirillum amazonense]
MGASLSGKQSTGRGRRRARPMADINVTPMVDVMLVLLIIFMVTAPLLTVGVPVDLPKTNAKAIPGQDEPLVVSIRDNGDIYLNETKTDLTDLVPRLEAISQNNADARIFVRGDKSLAYGRIVEVMGAISSAGYKKVSLIAQLPDTPARR